MNSLTKNVNSESESLPELVPPTSPDDLISQLRDAKDRLGSERERALDLLCASHTILFLAVRNAAEAGNVTCKLAMINLLKLHGKI